MRNKQIQRLNRRPVRSNVTTRPTGRLSIHNQHEVPPHIMNIVNNKHTSTITMDDGTVISEDQINSHLADCNEWFTGAMNCAATSGVAGGTYCTSPPCCTCIPSGYQMNYYWNASIQHYLDMDLGGVFGQ